MAGEKMSYETLQSMYYRLSASHKRLEQESCEKEAKWKESEKAYRHTITKARELCEMIVAKVQNNEFLGKSFSWSSMNADDLIAEAKKIFAAYNAERTNELKVMQAKIKELTSANENLQTQVEFYMNNLNSGEAVPPVQFNQTPAPTEESKAVANALPDRTKGSVREAAKNGTAEIVYMEEDSDVSELDMMQQADMVELGEQLQIDSSRPPIELTAKTKKNQKRASEAAKTSNIAMIDIEKLKEGLTDRRWAIIKAIGTTGHCTPKDIYYDIYKEDYGEASAAQASKFKIDVHNLYLANIVLQEQIANPLNPRMCIYSLSATGTILYKQKYNTDPVENVRAAIIRDHDNLNHGFGVLTLAEVIASASEIVSVSSDRKANTIKLHTGDTYIPDIVAKTNRYTAYFEYERGTHNQTNMQIKLNRMALVTSYINIVVPETGACKEVNKKVEKWIQARGGPGCLPKHTVRITTLKKMRDAIKAGASINSEDIWVFSYDLGKKA